MTNDLNDETDALGEWSHEERLEWAREMDNRRAPTPHWAYPLIPFLYLIGWSMEIGQRVTGDRSRGAFPTGCCGSLVGVAMLMTLISAIAALIWNFV